MLHNIQPVCQSVAIVIHLQFRDKEKLCSYSQHMSEEINSFTVGNSGHCYIDSGWLCIFKVVWLGGNGFAIQWMDWGDESPQFGSLQAR